MSIWKSEEIGYSCARMVYCSISRYSVDIKSWKEKFIYKLGKKVPIENEKWEMEDNRNEILIRKEYQKSI